MAWLMSGCVVWYFGECFPACGMWPCYYCFGTAITCFFCDIKPAGSGILRNFHYNSGSTNCIIRHQSSARSVQLGYRRSRNLPHNSVQQSAARSTTSRLQHTTQYNKPKPALPVDVETTQTARVQQLVSPGGRPISYRELKAHNTSIFSTRTSARPPSCLLLKISPSR